MAEKIDEDPELGGAVDYPYTMVVDGHRYAVHKKVAEHYVQIKMEREARVTELLKANNALVEQRREITRNWAERGEEIVSLSNQIVVLQAAGEAAAAQARLATLEIERMGIIIDGLTGAWKGAIDESSRLKALCNAYNPGSEP